MGNLVNMDFVSLVAVKRDHEKKKWYFLPLPYLCDPAVFVKTKVLPMQNTTKNCWKDVCSFLCKFSISSMSVTT